MVQQTGCGMELQLWLPPCLLLCELCPGLEELHFPYLYWEAVPIRLWVFCFLFSFHRQRRDSTEEFTWERDDLPQDRTFLKNFIPEKTGDLSKAEMEVTFRVHIFLAYSTYCV